MGTYLYCRTYKKISINLLSIELILHVMCACYFMYHEVPCYALTNLFGTIQYVSLSKRIYYNKRHYKYDPLCKSLFKRYYPVPSSTQNTWLIYNWRSTGEGMVPTEPESIHSSLNLTTATWLRMEMEIVIWTKLKRKQMLREITASRRNWSAGVPATSGRKISMRRLQGAGGATLAGGGRRRGGRRRGTRSRTVPAAAFAPPPRPGAP